MESMFAFRVAGISHCQAAASRCVVGDAVRLMAEPHNPFDSNAIRVDVRGEKIGYVPREQTSSLRSFAPEFESAVVRVEGVLGGGSGFLTGIEIVVEDRSE